MSSLDTAPWYFIDTLLAEDGDTVIASIVLSWQSEMVLFVHFASVIGLWTRSLVFSMGD